jgi:peptidoglycan/xylan/chitin deacetylase (PgdA/CDA1 family)
MAMMSAPSRRGILKAAGACLVAGAARAGSTTGLIEPRMSLKARSSTGAAVALTLDACPGGFDARIATALVEMAVPATVFATGAWIRRHPEAVAFLRAHPDLFAMENHGDRHIPPVLGDRRVFGIQGAGDLTTIKREILNGAADIERLTGAPPRWYRGATGFYSPAALEAIEGWGLLIAGYSLNADAGASLPAGAVARRIAAARDGDVIVAHVNQPTRSSGAGVVQGVRALHERGVRFVRLDRLGRSDVSYGPMPDRSPG